MRLQHLLSRAKWDVVAAHDDIRGYVVEHLSHDAVLVVDETGDLKKGTGTVGVQHQYTGTAGRIEDSQVAVYRIVVGRDEVHGANSHLPTRPGWQLASYSPSPMTTRSPGVRARSAQTP